MGFIVAIDGPAASGKGTISRAIAERFGLAHLDTGLLYRAVARKVLDGSDPVEAAASLRPDDVAREDLRTPEVAEMASRVAANPEVRAELVKFQRAFARRAGGAVLDGRDIGTVICPDADVKLFVTANERVRAERRWRELRDRGLDVSYEDVLAETQARDRRDMARAVSPLRPAEDAVILDTSELSVDEAVERAAAIVAEALARKKGKAG